MSESKYCENCGCRSYKGACVNCHEAIYIEQHYQENGDPVPDSISELADKNRIEIRDQKRIQSEI